MKRRGFILGAASIAASTLLPGCAREYIDVKTVEASANYKNGLFRNPVPTVVMKEGTLWKTVREWFNSDTKREPPKRFHFRADFLRTNPGSSTDLAIMWMGHSTLLIEIDGKRFLTDPIWSRRASPVSFAGPARFFPAPLPLKKLPALDGVILSHDHLDHLDSNTIKTLAKSGVVFYLPLGVGTRLTSWGIPPEQIREFDWWDKHPIGKTHQLIATPARHFSGRGLFDRYETLWSSWVIRGPHHTVFFGGDSGLFPGFKTIGEKLGPFDMTFLEIGAYNDNWGDIHLGPRKALRAHHDLNGRVMFPIHWGLFNLGLHSWDSPVEELLIAAKGENVALTLPRPGQLVTPSDFGKISYWWRTDNSCLST